MVDTFAQELCALRPNLMRVALRATRGRYAEAEDLVQNALLRCWVKRDHFEPNTNLFAWAVTILKHAYANMVKYGKCSNRDFRLTCPLEEAPESAMEHHQDFIIDTIRAVDALPLHYRSTLIAMAMSDQAEDDVATALKIPVGTVKSRTYRARALIREYLKCK